jgi:Rod binding domain-containing protein
MLTQMFKDVGAEAPFNGGQGEAAFKSFMSDAMAKQMVRSGGIGLADTVGKEMLKLQGLS